MSEIRRTPIFKFEDEYYYADEVKCKEFREVVGFKDYNTILDVIENGLIKSCSPNDKVYMSQLDTFVERLTVDDIDAEFNIVKDFIRFYKYNVVAYLLKSIYNSEEVFGNNVVTLSDQQAKVMTYNYVGSLNILPDNELFYIIPPDIVDKIANKYKKKLLH